MNTEKIGNFIAECRRSKNLTQSDLSEKLNISNKSISKWEEGRKMPDSSVMFNLCNLLDISVNELLSGEHLKESQYKEKVTENLISITKEYDKNKKMKNLMIILIASIFIFLLLAFILELYMRILNWKLIMTNDKKSETQ